jgi:carbonic anhydrase/acetyltransferase-like protein (isoleucine patch superfamily)
VIESECIVGASALVTEGKHFERGSLIVGAPARAVRQVRDEEKQALRISAAHYAKKAARYAAELRKL